MLLVHRVEEAYVQKGVHFARMHILAKVEQNLVSRAVNPNFISIKKINEINI